MKKIRILLIMNCTLMLQNLSSYHSTDPIKLQIQRECISDGLTIMVTFTIIIIAFIFTLFDNNN